MRRVIRIGSLVLLLLILAAVVWLWVTPEGRDSADDLCRVWRQWRHGGEEQAVAEKLTAMGARLCRAAPPDQHYTSLNCTNLILGDDGYQLVGKCFRLESVSFDGCDMTDERIKCLTGLSDLTSLNILRTPTVTDAGMKNIGSLRKLVGLNLMGTGVGDASLKQIGRLSELGTLCLWDTRITDDGLPALTGLGKLQWLVLTETAVTDDGVVKLKGLSSLRQLTLKGSKVTGKGKAELMKMYPGLMID